MFHFLSDFFAIKRKSVHRVPVFFVCLASLCVLLTSCDGQDPSNELASDPESSPPGQLQEGGAEGSAAELSSLLTDSTSLPEGRGDYRLRYSFDRALEHNGITYRERKNLTSILILGIDQDSDLDLSNDFRGGGQSDFMRVIVLDHDNKTIQQLEIDRDTMTEVDILGVLGQKAGQRKMQICLAHSYGGDRNENCENAVRAVSRLLLDQPIDLYGALYLNGLATMNDYVGGVEVTVRDDLTNVDPALYPGAKVLLTGNQAESFVRSRMSVGDGTNVERMARQEEYLRNFAPKFKAKIMQDEASAQAFLKALDPYIATNAGQGRMINEGLKAKNYQVLPTLKISGEHVLAKTGFVEYNTNKDGLIDMVLDLFFEPVD